MKYIISFIVLTLFAGCDQRDRYHEELARETADLNPADTIFVTVPVSLSDDNLQMQEIIPAGNIMFEVTNNGTTEHNFRIEGEDVNESFHDPLQPGETKRIFANIPEGEYEAICPLGNHADEGMRASFRALPRERSDNLRE
jgi:muconolactone delta-isomerase